MIGIVWWLFLFGSGKEVAPMNTMEVFKIWMNLTYPRGRRRNEISLLGNCKKIIDLLRMREYETFSVK